MAIGDRSGNAYAYGRGSRGTTSTTTGTTATTSGTTTTSNTTTSTGELEAAIETRAQQIAQQIVTNQVTAAQLAGSGRIFTPFNEVTDVIPNQKTLVTAGLFSDSSSSINSLYTSSTQNDSTTDYYYACYKDNPGSNSEIQFSVAYGHRLGEGSYSVGQLNDSATRAVYSQYKQMLLDPGVSTFTFGTSGSCDKIYVINFDRSRLRDRLDPGNWEFSLASLTGSYTNNDANSGSLNVLNIGVLDTSYSGSTNQARYGKVITLVDDSGDTDQSVGFSAAGRVYNIVSGSLTNGAYIANNDYVYYGVVYPDMGMMVLDGNMLDNNLYFHTVTGSSIAGDNASKLYKSIKGAMAQSATGLYGFQGRNEEVINSTHYFVRVKNGEYNFSNNPSFTTGSVGEFSQPSFIGDPKVYITTIGMYNDSQELLAVAKLSKPVQKSFQNEALIKVKLDF